MSSWCKQIYIYFVSTVRTPFAFVFARRKKQFVYASSAGSVNIGGILLQRHRYWNTASPISTPIPSYFTRPSSPPHPTSSQFHLHRTLPHPDPTQYSAAVKQVVQPTVPPKSKIAERDDLSMVTARRIGVPSSMKSSALTVPI